MHVAFSSICRCKKDIHITMKIMKKKFNIIFAMMFSFRWYSHFIQLPTKHIKRTGADPPYTHMYNARNYLQMFSVRCAWFFVSLNIRTNLLEWSRTDDAKYCIFWLFFFSRTFIILKLRLSEPPFVSFLCKTPLYTCVIAVYNKLRHFSIHLKGIFDIISALFFEKYDNNLLMKIEIKAALLALSLHMKPTFVSDTYDDRWRVYVTTLEMEMNRLIYTDILLSRTTNHSSSIFNNWVNHVMLVISYRSRVSVSFIYNT